MSKKSLSSSSRVNILSARTSNSSTYNTSTSNCNKRKLSTNNDNTDLVTEDLKKSLKDSIRRNLFIHDKYPTDLKIEKYCKESLSKTYPQNQNYINRQLWDGVWFKLRQPVCI